LPLSLSYIVLLQCATRDTECRGVIYDLLAEPFEDGRHFLALLRATYSIGNRSSQRDFLSAFDPIPPREE